MFDLMLLVAHSFALALIIRSFSLLDVKPIQIEIFARFGKWRSFQCLVKI